MVGPSSSSLAAKAKDFMPVRSFGAFDQQVYSTHQFTSTTHLHIYIYIIVVATGNYPSQWSEVFRMAHVWEEFFNVASADAQAMVEAQRSSSGLEKEKMHSMAYDSRTPQTSDSWAKYFFMCRCLGLTMLSIEAAQIVPQKMARTFAIDQLAWVTHIG